jgi:calcineurin-like phosphoesterase
MSLKILFIGDVVGAPGRRIISQTAAVLHAKPRHVRVIDRLGGV